jgi:crotonobetainyl-CoA:carnitine CoA-transferase CaiB-like acyl-CoA transferase
MTYDLLAGVRVVEVAMYAFAPSCAAVLAEWGADVIKVVPPQVADPMRGNPIAGLPKKDVGISFMWELLNRGKRCIGLDVGTPDGRDVLVDMVKEADVFLTNLLPRARTKMRIDPADLHEVKPDLVYARASGHGNEGPEADAGGYDHTDFWARTGIAQAAGQVADEFVPQPGPAMGDLTAGAVLAGAIAAALFRRSRTGAGAVIDVSLLSAGLWVGAPAVLAGQLYGVDTIPRMRHAQLPNPLVAAYATRDGRQIYLAGILTDKHFDNFCEVTNRPDLLTDPRFATGEARLANAAECIRVLDDLFATRDLDEWLKVLPGLTTPWTVVQTAAEAATDPQVVANGYVDTVESDAGRWPLVRTPAQFDDIRPTLTRAPEHAEHTEEVLLELGRSWDDIARMQESGAIA